MKTHIRYLSKPLTAEEKISLPPQEVLDFFLQLLTLFLPYLTSKNNDNPSTP